MPPVEILIVERFLWLLLAALAVALVARRLALPFTVALLVVGGAIGVLGQLPGTMLSPQIITVVFLPALLFQAAIELDINTLRTTVFPILVFAIVGVAISIGIIGGIFSVTLGVSLATAIVLASMVSATDPVAVLSIFAKLGVARRLSMIVEGESLFNDGTALVIFNIALAAASSSARTSLASGVRDFIVMVVGGAILGAAAGFAASHLMALTADHLVEMGLSTVVAYGSYLLGEAMHVSPVIAVVVAGIVLGNYGRQIGMSQRARALIFDQWEYLAFLVNSLVFLLVGMAVRQAHYLVYLRAAVVSIALVLLSRAAVVYGLAPLISKLHLELPIAWRHLIFWGGLRGALTVAMALSLPAELPEHDLLLTATFAVVIFTVLVQGLTIEPLVERLALRSSSH